MNTVAGEPTNLAAESNSTHVTVSWKSPGGPVTGYVIYYQPEGSYNSSVHVSGGGTESHSLDCLERGVTYYISIVALSDHLPSPVVGPVTVIPDSEFNKYDTLLFPLPCFFTSYMFKQK